MKSHTNIAFGGGCHWCTEAVFQSIKGVENVEQGYVSSIDENNSFSEAVIVNYNMECVNLTTLIEIHLLTHNSTSDHSMRNKYRSAIYTFNDSQQQEVIDLLQVIQHKYAEKFITQILPFGSFTPSRVDIKDYYYKNPKKPFCETFINPKLKFLLQSFYDVVDHNKIDQLQLEN